MTRYKVIVTDRATIAIVEYAEFIARQSGSWKIAEDWMARVYEAVSTLESMPDRFEVATESGKLGFEIRRLLIGKYIANYMIDYDDAVVWIVGFRHGSRLPRPGDLPHDPAS